MSPPASNFDQRSSSVINQYYSSAAAKAASKKLSQAKWYQKNKERERQRARARAAYKREKLRRKALHIQTGKCTHASSQHRANCAKKTKQHIAQQPTHTLAQKLKELRGTGKTTGHVPSVNSRVPIKTQGHIPSVAVSTDSNDEDELPTFYDSDDTIPIASDDVDVMPIVSPPLNNPYEWERFSDGGRSPSPAPTPKPSQQQRDNAIQCLVAIANITLTWNSDWGPISNWSQQFAKTYISAVDEGDAAEFIEVVEKQAQVGRQLMDDILHVLTDCVLPTSETALKAFTQLMLRLIFRINKGIVVLEDRVRLVSSLPYNLE